MTTSPKQLEKFVIKIPKNKLCEFLVRDDIDYKSLIRAAKELNQNLERKREKVILIRTWKEYDSEINMIVDIWDELGFKIEENVGRKSDPELIDKLWEIAVNILLYLQRKYSQKKWIYKLTGFWPEPVLFYEEIMFVNKSYLTIQVPKKSKHKKKIEALKKMAKAGNCYLMMSPRKLYVVPFPKIKFNQRGCLHSEEGPAIEFLGRKMYWLEGVKFHKRLWEAVVNNKLSLQKILKIKNIEQRIVALKYAKEKILESAILLDKSKRGNELYLIKDIFPKPAYFLKYTCPSTGRVYIKGVAPKIGKLKNADLAQAHSFGITLEEYYSLKIET